MPYHRDAIAVESGLATGHDGWIYQGRQYHQWFGHGTKPKDAGDDVGTLAQRIHSLGNTMAFSLPQSLRYHPVTRMDADDHAAFDRVMLAMARSAGASPADFARHFFDTTADAPFVAPLQEAARLIAGAQRFADVRAANDSLAKAVLAAGLDRWLRYVRAAAGRIEGRDGPPVVLARGGPGLPVVAPDVPLVSPLAAGVIAASVLLTLYSQQRAEAAVRAAAARFGLDLSKEADLRAAIASVFAMSAGPRALEALTGSADRELAARAVMEAERAHPGVFEAAIRGIPAAQAALHEAAASLGAMPATHDADEAGLVESMRAAGKSPRQVAAALEDFRARRRMQVTGVPRDGKDGPPGWIPLEVVERLPSGWGMGRRNRKDDNGKEGWRWQSPSTKGDGVRIDKGDPNSNWPSQRVDHVIVVSSGKIIGRDGKPISGRIDQNAENAHIPLTEYRRWHAWNKP